LDDQALKIIFKFTGFIDFVYRPEFYINGKQNVSETAPVGSLDQSLRLSLCKGPTEGAFLPSPEEGNRCSFRNIMFSN
jgi:hypothetical protein